MQDYDEDIEVRWYSRIRRTQGSRSCCPKWQNLTRNRWETWLSRKPQLPGGPCLGSRSVFQRRIQRHETRRIHDGRRNPHHCMSSLSAVRLMMCVDILQLFPLILNTLGCSEARRTAIQGGSGAKHLSNPETGSTSITQFVSNCAEYVSCKPKTQNRPRSISLTFARTLLWYIIAPKKGFASFATSLLPDRDRSRPRLRSGGKLVISPIFLPVELTEKSPPPLSIISCSQPWRHK